jgi:hypothetical protein
MNASVVEKIVRALSEGKIQMTPMAKKIAAAKPPVKQQPVLYRPWEPRPAIEMEPSQKRETACVGGRVLHSWRWADTEQRCRYCGKARTGKHAV